MLGAPKEIKEVKNAYDAYEEILSLNPYSQKDFLHAHGLLTKDTVNNSGKYRYNMKLKRSILLKMVMPHRDTH